MDKDKMFQELEKEMDGINKPEPKPGVMTIRVEEALAMETRIKELEKDIVAGVVSNVRLRRERAILVKEVNRLREATRKAARELENL